MSESAPSSSSSAARALICIAISVIALVFVAIPMFMYPATAYTGVRIHFTGAPVQPNIIDVDLGSPAYRAGLRNGDVLGCLSVRDRNLLFERQLLSTDAGYVPGSPIHLCVRDGAAWKPASFIPATRPPDETIYFNTLGVILRLFAYAMILLCAFVLVTGRPGLMTWLFFAYAVCGGPTALVSANYAVLPPALYAAAFIVANVATTASNGLLLLFAILVPDDVPIEPWRARAYRIGLIAPAGLAALGWMQYCQPNVIVLPAVTTYVIGAVLLATTAIVFVRLAAMQSKERGRFGWAAFAILWAVVADFLRGSGVLPQSIGGHIAITTVVTPLVLLYAILKRHVIDVRFAISRTLVYASITTLVVGVIGAVDWATSVYLHEARIAMALDAAVTIGIAFALNRVHHWLENAVDFLLYRNKYEAETYLRRLARTLVNAQHQETVDRAIVRDPYHRLQLTMAALCRLTGSAFVVCASAGCDESSTAGFEHDHDLVRFLTTERRLVFVRDLTQGSGLLHGSHAQPVIAIPIFQGLEMTAFALYGLHRDGTNLDPDENETLKHLCECAAQAYTLIDNARYRAMLQTAPT